MNFEHRLAREPRSGTRSPGRRETQAQNASANAIRWGTLYNFRFDANAAPQSGTITLGLWKRRFGDDRADVPAGGFAGRELLRRRRLDPHDDACPCANTGAIGHGCDELGRDRRRVARRLGDDQPRHGRADGRRASSPARSRSSCKATGISPPVVFGDGLRCIGGNLKRLYVKNAVGGTARAPGPATLRSRAQSAALGDPIARGPTREYQVYYRDPDLAFCPDPPGNSLERVERGVDLW